MDIVEVTHDDFNVQDQYQRIRVLDGQGAIVLFVGLVRDFNDK